MQKSSSVKPIKSKRVYLSEKPKIFSSPQERMSKPHHKLEPITPVQNKLKQNPIPISNLDRKPIFFEKKEIVKINNSDPQLNKIGSGKFSDMSFRGAENTSNFCKLPENNKITFDEGVAPNMLEVYLEMLNNDSDLFFLESNFPEKYREYLGKLGKASNSSSTTGGGISNSKILNTVLSVIYDKPDQILSNPSDHGSNLRKWTYLAKTDKPSRNPVDTISVLNGMHGMNDNKLTDMKSVKNKRYPEFTTSNQVSGVFQRNFIDFPIMSAEELHYELKNRPNYKVFRVKIELKVSGSVGIDVGFIQIKNSDEKKDEGSENRMSSKTNKKIILINQNQKENGGSEGSSKQNFCIVKKFFISKIYRKMKYYGHFHVEFYKFLFNKFENFDRVIINVHKRNETYMKFLRNIGYRLEFIEHDGVNTLSLRKSDFFKLHSY